MTQGTQELIPGPARPAVNIVPLALVERERRLPRPGQVRVAEGREVTFAEVVAATPRRHKVILLDIARLLGVDPAQARQALRVRAKDRVEKGDVLAELRRGLTRRRVLAPQRGRVMGVDAQARLLLRVGIEWDEVLAGLNGRVARVLEPWGAVIRAEGSYIEGVWGNGQVAAGLLRPLTARRTAPVDEEDLGLEHRGAVGVAGYCTDPQVLARAEDLSFRGLVVGGLSHACLEQARRVSFPVLVTDGFGPVPMNEEAFRLLSSAEGRSAVVLAEPWDQDFGARPCVMLDLPHITQAERVTPGESLLVGQTVRILSATQPDQVGTLLSSMPRWERLPNGLKALVVDVRLRSGQHIIAPIVNIEILR